MLFDIELYIVLITFLSLITLPLFKKQTQVKVYFIAMLTLSLFSILHYWASFNAGREGFSILTKGYLDDEIIYHNTAIFVSQGLTPQQILDAQQHLVGYTSPKSIYFGSVIGFFYFILVPKLIVAKPIIVYFSALSVTLLYTILRKLISRKYAFIFALLLLAYPSFIIHSIQLEKDSFVLLLFLIVLNQIINFMFKKKTSFILILVPTYVLFMMRPQYGVLILTMMASIFAMNYEFFYKKSWKFYVVAMMFIVPLPVLIIKYTMPSLFAFLDATKRYSVFAGTIGFLKHNYSSYVPIFITLLWSYYYFIFGPISTYVLHASMMWKILMIEPIMFVIIPLYFLFTKGKREKITDPMVWKLILIFTILILVYTFLSVVFESNFSGYLRKRMIIFVFFIIIFTLTNREKFI